MSFWGDFLQRCQGWNLDGRCLHDGIEQGKDWASRGLGNNCHWMSNLEIAVQKLGYTKFAIYRTPPPKRPTADINSFLPLSFLDMILCIETEIRHFLDPTFKMLPVFPLGPNGKLSQVRHMGNLGISGGSVGSSHLCHWNGPARRVRGLLKEVRCVRCEIDTEWRQRRGWKAQCMGVPNWS